MPLYRFCEKRFRWAILAKDDRHGMWPCSRDATILSVMSFRFMFPSPNDCDFNGGLHNAYRLTAGRQAHHRKPDDCPAKNCGWLGVTFGADHPACYTVILRTNSSSSMTGIPSCCALASLLPASTPARTKLVFLETLPETLPPCFSMTASISFRL